MKRMVRFLTRLKRYHSANLAQSSTVAPRISEPDPSLWSAAQRCPTEILQYIIDLILSHPDSKCFNDVFELLSECTSPQKTFQKAFNVQSTTLAPIVLTCRTWYASGISTLYATPLLATLNAVHCLRRTVGCQPGIAKHVGHILIINDIFPDPKVKPQDVPVKELFTLCPSLGNVVICNDNGPVRISCVQRQSDTHACRVSIAGSSPKYHPDPVLIPPSIASLSNLRVLFIQEYFFDDTIHFPHLPQLKSLHLVECLCRVSRSIQIPSARFPSLKMLSVQNSPIQMDDVKKIPSLMSFRLVDGNKVEPWMKMLKSSTLRELAMMFHTAQDAVASIASFPPSLKRLYVVIPMLQSFKSNDLRVFIQQVSLHGNIPIILVAFDPTGSLYYSGIMNRLASFIISNNLRGQVYLRGYED
ncbi:hypothetical protein QCA50_014350 [Cerrena zonata]|uniref:F-box domain-containing protein n=1 Tax=Cerrena zonata TaxID=2478898 RepID=A0AAW0FUM1_9APHY